MNDTKSEINELGSNNGSEEPVTERDEIDMKAISSTKEEEGKASTPKPSPKANNPKQEVPEQPITPLETDTSAPSAGAISAVETDADVTTSTLSQKLKGIVHGLTFTFGNSEKSKERKKETQAAPDSTLLGTVSQAPNLTIKHEAPIPRSVFRRILLRYYEEQCPPKMSNVDTILDFYAGRERDLWIQLEQTYGVAPRWPSAAEAKRRATGTRHGRTNSTAASSVEGTTPLQPVLQIPENAVKKPLAPHEHKSSQQQSAEDAHVIVFPVHTPSSLLRNILVRYFQLYDPAHYQEAMEVEQLLSQYAGREASLWASLHATYGALPPVPSALEVQRYLEDTEARARIRNTRAVGVQAQTDSDIAYNEKQNAYNNLHCSGCGCGLAGEPEEVVIQAYRRVPGIPAVNSGLIPMIRTRGCQCYEAIIHPYPDGTLSAHVVQPHNYYGTVPNSEDTWPSLPLCSHSGPLHHHMRDVSVPGRMTGRIGMPSASDTYPGGQNAMERSSNGLLSTSSWYAPRGESLPWPSHATMQKPSGTLAWDPTFPPPSGRPTVVRSSDGLNNSPTWGQVRGTSTQPVSLVPFHQITNKSTHSSFAGAKKMNDIQYRWDIAPVISRISHHHASM